MFFGDPWQRSNHGAKPKNTKNRTFHDMRTSHRSAKEVNDGTVVEGSEA